ncbi:MAG TPA: SDR family NAD(P)-dependent oxidoreductase, partial [Acidimicrobiales bacterium]
EDRIALVTGASKGIGRGIAVQLGADGATVFVTARNQPELELTASRIVEAGGQATALACDHGDDGQVAAVFDEIAQRHGRLDLLVNNASPDFSSMVGKPFWELPAEAMDACLDIGPRSNFVASAHAARLMIEQRRGLIVNISSHGAEDYILATTYGAGKAAIDKLTRDMALELAPYDVAVVSLWPGLVKTERVMRQIAESPDGRAEVAGLDLAIGESPLFSGLAITALATDPDLLARSGGSYMAARLASEYGFPDVDGTQPRAVRGLRSIMAEAEIPPFWRTVEPFTTPPRLGDAGTPAPQG